MKKKNSKNQSSRKTNGKPSSRPNSQQEITFTQVGLKVLDIDTVNNCVGAFNVAPDQKIGVNVVEFKNMKVQVVEVFLYKMDVVGNWVKTDTGIRMAMGEDVDQFEKNNKCDYLTAEITSEELKQWAEEEKQKQGKMN